MAKAKKMSIADVPEYEICVEYNGKTWLYRRVRMVLTCPTEIKRGTDKHRCGEDERNDDAK